MTLVLDSSALVAMMEGEPEAEALMAALLAADACAISAVTAFETRVVMLRRRGPAGLRMAERFIARTGASVVPFDAAMAEAAGEAYARFGKGIDPRARLNLGDCASYALAKALDAPLLFKGGDFGETDVAVLGRPARG